MLFFGKKKDKEDDEEEFEDEEETPPRRKFRDLNPENRKKRKEPVKPWGKKERLIVFVFLLLTVLIPATLAASARNWKLPGLPKIAFPNLSFENEPIIIEGDDTNWQKTLRVKTYFQDTTQKLSGVYGLYVVRLDDGTSYGVNQTEVMQAASLIKLPIMATVYRQAVDGEIDLDTKVPNSTFTYRQLLEAMGNRSDNAAQIKVQAAVGKEKIQDMIKDIGMGSTSLEENLTSPQDIGLFFQRLYKGLVITEGNKDEMLGFLTNTIHEDWIAKGISGEKVAHKYGREVHVVNDAGIVFSEPSFVLVILSDGVIESEADKVIPEIAGEIYRIEASP